LTEYNILYDFTFACICPEVIQGSGGATPWRRVLLEKLTGLQLVKKYTAFHGTRRFIRIRRGRYIWSWWGNRRERDHWGDLDVDGWIILGWISRRWDVGIWTGLGWPGIWTGGGRL